MTAARPTDQRLDSSRLDTALGSFGGELIRPGDDGYDAARALWNGMAQRSPAAVARCADAGDVQAVIRAAVAHGVPLAVRGGGHNVAGTAGVDGGVVVDLSPMRRVDVDAARRLVHVGGGATWGDVDRATQPHGLAVPGGLVSQTGVGGLTLGGGIGWLRRKYGMACDSLVGATVVTADAEVRHVDERADPDLMWALRGGGGNFGVATELTFRLHPVGPDVFVGFVVYPGHRTHEVLAAYGRWTESAGDEVSSLVMCGTVPHAEEFPRESWARPAVMVVACAATDPVDGARLVGPLRELAEPVADLSGPMPYVELQSLFDADYPEGARYYWKSVHLPALTGTAIDLAAAWAARRPSPLSTVDLWHLGGAMARVPAGATAYGDRAAPFLLGAEANWLDAEDDGANIAWARDCVDAFAPLSTGREYLNFPGLLESGQAALRTAYGEDNFARLARIKRRLDPNSVFRLHQYVPPAPAR